MGDTQSTPLVFKPVDASVPVAPVDASVPVAPVVVAPVVVAPVVVANTPIAQIKIPITQIENEMTVSSDVATPKPPSINPKYIKFIGADRKNFGFEFCVGRNVDVLPFNSKVDCGAGGLYFCTPEQASRWISSNDYALIAEVEIPDGAEVVHMPDHNKSKANVIDITSITPIEDHPLWQNPKFANSCLPYYPKVIRKLAMLPYDCLHRPSFLSRHADELIGRPELTLKHYVMMASVFSEHIRKFPAKITDNPEFWTEVLKENPKAIRFMTKADPVKNLDIFYGPSYCNYLSYRLHQTPAMKFLGALYGGFNSKIENLDDAALFNICRWSSDGSSRIPDDRLTREMRDALDANPYIDGTDASKLTYIHTSLEEIFNRLVISNEFLRKLYEIGLLNVLFGGVVREVVIRHLESCSSQSNGQITWDDLKDYMETSDIDLCVNVPFIGKPRSTLKKRTNTKAANTYDLTSLVAIVKDCGGIIEFYSTKYVEEQYYRSSERITPQTITAASAGTYAVWIPISNAAGVTTKYMRYDINVGTSVTNSDTLLNSLTVSFNDTAGAKINGLTTTAMLDLLRSRVLLPSHPAIAVGKMSSQLGKCLIRTGKLYAKGYKLDRYTGLIYHLQILQCRGLNAAIQSCRIQKCANANLWVAGQCMNTMAVIRTSTMQRAVDANDNAGFIGISATTTEPVTPEFVLKSLPDAFVAECAAIADTWEDDFSIVESYATESLVAKIMSPDY